MIKSALTVHATLVAVLVGFIPSVAADDEALFQRVLEQRSPAIVTVKCVVKVKSGRTDQEMESESSGVMIEPKGLVLCSNSRLGGAFGLARRLMGAGSITVTPTDLKVIVGDAADGLDARFLARDSELDLAWIQIKEPGDKTFAHVDLSRSAAPKVGQRLLSVYRTSKIFDRAPIVVENVVGGAVRKPRELFMAGDLSASLGLPAFTADGRVAGVCSLQVPEADDEATMQDLARGRITNSHEYSGALLPVSEVLKATARAKESPASEPATDEAEGASTTKPAAGKQSDGEKENSKEE